MAHGTSYAGTRERETRTVHTHRVTGHNQDNETHGEELQVTSLTFSGGRHGQGQNSNISTSLRHNVRSVSLVRTQQRLATVVLGQL